MSYLPRAHRNTGDNNIDIGHQGIAGEVKTIRSGTQGTQVRTFIAGISDTALRAGVLVRVDVAGQLGPVPSLARFKQNIKLTDKASEAVLALKPVIFRHKHAYDPESIAQFGLVVEDVEKVADKSRPPQTHSGMSRRREQKHLIHNWSDCRCRDRAQTPRAVLRVGVASGSQRLIPTGGRIGLRSYR